MSSAFWYPSYCFYETIAVLVKKITTVQNLFKICRCFVATFHADLFFEVYFPIPRDGLRISSSAFLTWHPFGYYVILFTMSIRGQKVERGVFRLPSSVMSQKPSSSPAVQFSCFLSMQKPHPSSTHPHSPLSLAFRKGSNSHW